MTSFMMVAYKDQFTPWCPECDLSFDGLEKLELLTHLDPFKIGNFIINTGFDAVANRIKSVDKAINNCMKTTSTGI